MTYFFIYQTTGLHDEWEMEDVYVNPWEEYS
jgi:hypothetical protein